jgi:hypothetical protein
MMVTSLGLGDTLADGIVERCAATGAVGFPVQILGLCFGQIVVVPGSVASIEGEQGDELLLLLRGVPHPVDAFSASSGGIPHPVFAFSASSGGFPHPVFAFSASSRG